MLIMVGRSAGLGQLVAVFALALWSGAAAAFQHLAGWVTPQRRTVHASGVSDEWLRCHAIESAKHRYDR